MSAPRDRLFAVETPCAGTVLASGNARVDLAEAMGRCEAGERVTVAIGGDELPRVVDLLQEAARRLLPLIVRVPLDSGEAGLFTIADTGVCVLLAVPGEIGVVHLVARLLAERALLPVVLACRPAGNGDGNEPAKLPAPAIGLIGDAADFVPSVTPAQELLFGKDRRRVVRWFDLERPVLRGQSADESLRTLQRAGFAPFVHSPVRQLLEDAAAEVQRATGVAWSTVDLTGTDKADVLVASLKGHVESTAALAETVAAGGKRPRTGFVTLNSLRPFPESWLASLRKKSALVVLSAADTMLAGEPPLLREVRAGLVRVQAEDRTNGRAWKDKEVPSMHAALSGLGGETCSPEDVAAFVRECASSAGRPLVYLGVDFAPLGGKLPKRRVLHETLRRAHPGIEQLGLRTQPPAPAAAVPRAPLRVEAPPQQDPTHDNITRSWDLVAAAAVTGASDELAPDPYLTAGSVPALTSLFRGNTASDELPAFAPEQCTGCGACWTACPDSALLPAVLGPRELLESGMRAAAGAGRPADALQPMLGRLAKALPKAIAAGAHNAGQAIRQAAEPMLAKLDEDRRPPMEEAIDAVAEAMDTLPVTCTEPFFARCENKQPGSGNLFVLALDPDACKGCNLCVAVCEPMALAPRERSGESIDIARRTAALWRTLPDTAGSVIAAARELPEPGLLGALQLSRHCLQALAPGDDAEPGSGARIALRAVLAAAEAWLQPKLQQHVHQLDELAEDFGKRIRELLAGALPTSDLDALHEGLATIGMGAVALSTLAGRLDEVSTSGRVDTAKLQRFVDTARAVADLRWRIAEGSTGHGRSRTGLVLCGANASVLADRFPWNPFSAPAVLDGSPEAGHRAVGLLQGVTTATAAGFALLRRARALLEQGSPGPRTLSFDELTAEERQLCPPLWLVADAETLQHGGMQQIAAALASDLPIKVLLLQTSLDTSEPLTAALLALAHRQAFVLQSSIAHRDHLTAGVLAACEHGGPALVHVLAPSPQANDTTADQAIALAAAAVDRRAFPLLRYQPSLPGAFGQKLSLDGNPEPRAARTDDPVLLAGWETLQELAGVRTPFTSEVEQRATEATAAAHERDIAELRKQHDETLGQARATVEDELLARLQRKLTALAGGRRQ